jgi:hypothetical protein
VERLVVSDHNDRWWWLSFVNPGDERFLGVCVVKRHSFVAAVQRAHQLGINPGGQVAGQVLPEGEEPPEALRDKLVADRTTLDRIMRQWNDKRVGDDKDDEHETS